MEHFRHGFTIHLKCVTCGREGTYLFYKFTTVIHAENVQKHLELHHG